MQQPNWIFAFASVIGNSHISENIPCQDFCKVENYDNFSIAVVCDGAGTCINSQIGSKQVTDFCIYHFEKVIKNQKWDTLNELPPQDIWHIEAKNTLHSIKEDLDRFSMSNDLEFKSFILDKMMGLFFINAAEKMIEAFEAKAREFFETTK